MQDLTPFIGGIYGWITHRSGAETNPTDSGFSPIVGLGANLNVTDNITIRPEFEYVPSIGNGDRSAEPGPDDTTADVDVLAATLSVIWRF